jgi:hypothetical protein
MKCSMIRRTNRSAAAMLLMLLGLFVSPNPAQAEGKPNGEAVILFTTEGPSPFVLNGTAPHFGRFECFGELEFQPGVDEGSLDGVGVAVLEAANGDLIVGVVTCRLGANGAGQIHFSWRDAVEFSDGTTVGNTGRFLHKRPPGVVIAIIAILIG